MKFQVSDGEQYQKIMEAEIPSEEIELVFRQAAKRLAQKMNIPGFRKGKVPQNVIESFIGIDAILQETADELLPRAYFKGLEELGLVPLEQPKIEMINLTAREPMVFKATFTVKPEVHLGQYQGLAATKYIREAQEEDVEADLQTQRQRMASSIKVEEDAAIEHDILSIDFEGFHNGLPFEGGKGENYPLELGSKSFIPGFEEQLIGMREGEEREISLVFPEDYQQDSLAGQPVQFKVKVREIKRRLLPEFDDDFAQDVSETADNMEDLRLEIRERLNRQYDEEAGQMAKDSILQMAVENALIDLPPLMVEQRLDDMMHNLTSRLQTQGLEMEQFLSYSGLSAEEMRESYRQRAEFAVRSDLVLEAVAKAHDISVSEEDVEQELAELAAQYWQPLEQLRELMRKNNRKNILIEEIRLKKAAGFIYEAAEISEETAVTAQMT